MTRSQKIMRLVLSTQPVGGSRYTGYRLLSVEATLECGHKTTRKRSERFGVRAACYTCGQLAGGVIKTCNGVTEDRTTFDAIETRLKQGKKRSTDTGSGDR